MKNIALFLVAIFFSITAFSQDYTEIKSSQLPKKALEYINTNFKGSTIKRAAKTLDKETKYVAVTTLRKNKVILVFDKNGNFITRARNLDEVKKITGATSSANQTPAAKPPANNPNTDPPKSK